LNSRDFTLPAQRETSLSPFCELMPRTPRGQLSGHAFHVLSRGNGRARVFHEDGDYQAFIQLLEKAKARVPVRLFAFALLPNHFHAVLQPVADGSLSKFMHWWLTSHVRRYHRHHGTCGHVWQGRFKSFPIQQDEHFLTVVRYVLLNPVRASLVIDPHQWPWSSLSFPRLIDPWPVPPPEDWKALLRPLSAAELDEVRNSVRRQSPLGEPSWQTALARLGDLGSTLRPRGRPPHRT
jgi:REP-associated tyrosine transposase